MKCRSDLDMILKGAKRAAQRPPPSGEEVAREATRAAIWLARQGHDERHQHGEVLAWYMACYKLGHGAAAKGLALRGPVGTGKTVALQLLCRWTGAKYRTAAEIVDLYQADAEGWHEVMTPRLPVMANGTRYWPDLAIDDLGAEPLNSRYGMKGELIALLVDLREQYFRQYGGRLHLATNLERGEIVTRYGERTLSRLEGRNALCHWREWGGEDGRKAVAP